VVVAVATARTLVLSHDHAAAGAALVVCVVVAVAVAVVTQALFTVPIIAPVPAFAATVLEGAAIAVTAGALANIRLCGARGHQQAEDEQQAGLFPVHAAQSAAQRPNGR
jgi:hypothetical protein